MFLYRWVSSSYVRDGSEYNQTPVRRDCRHQSMSSKCFFLHPIVTHYHRQNCRGRTHHLFLSRCVSTHSDRATSHITRDGNVSKDLRRDIIKTGTVVVNEGMRRPPLSHGVWSYAMAVRPGSRSHLLIVTLTCLCNAVSFPRVVPAKTSL